jgi:SAM-dependent methyltransferase
MPTDLTSDLQLFSLEENPDRWERCITQEQVKARGDQRARRTLESIYCDEDRPAAFDRFAHSDELRVLLRLLELFGYAKADRICEIGGGPGWLGWALHRAGYRSIEMLEPNGHYNTGTGYLRTRDDARDIRIWNSLRDWYDDANTYDAILTHNCVHHFGNVAFVAACIRRRLKPGGRWLMVREQYARNSAELYALLRAHPYCQTYGVFEFAMPASHYIDAIELAGFRLDALIPGGYANGTLSSYVPSTGPLKNRVMTAAVDRVLDHAPSTTVALYRAARVASLCGLGPTRFERPEAALFTRTELA